MSGRNFYRRCWSCDTPDPSTHFRAEQHAVLCAACHVAAGRGERLTYASRTAPKVKAAPLVMFSEACLRVLAAACNQ